MPNTKTLVDDDWQNHDYYEPDASDVLSQISSGEFWDDPDEYQYEEDDYREDEEY